MNVTASEGSTMPRAQRAPGRNGRPSKDKTNHGIGKFLSNSSWLGIGAIAAVVAIGGAVAAVIAILPSDQHSTFAVLSVSFDQTSGEEVVTVTGTARNIPRGATLYAMAKPGDISVKAHQNAQASNQGPVKELAPKARSWFVGGPANIGNDGNWSVNIVIIPPIDGKLTVVPVEIGSCNNCITVLPSQLRRDLGMYGPNYSDAVGTGYTAQPR
jgi:hypothetical protein